MGVRVYLCSCCHVSYVLDSVFLSVWRWRFKESCVSCYDQGIHKLFSTAVQLDWNWKEAQFSSAAVA